MAISNSRGTRTKNTARGKGYIIRKKMVLFDVLYAGEKGVNMDYQKASIPEFKCHKKVKAFKILSISPNPLDFGSALYGCLNAKSIAVFPSEQYMAKHKPVQGGYYVLYEDGYESYSPTKAFEEGYSLMSNKAVSGESEELLQYCAVCGRELIREARTNEYFHRDPVLRQFGTSHTFCYPFHSNAMVTLREKSVSQLKESTENDYESYSREDLLKVIQLDDERIEALEQVVKLITECEAHRDLCLPNAKAWITEALKHYPPMTQNSTQIISGMLGELYADEKRRREESQGKKWEDPFGTVRTTYGLKNPHRYININHLPCS